MTGEALAALDRLRDVLPLSEDVAAVYSDDLATLLAEHDRLAAALLRLQEVTDGEWIKRAEAALAAADPVAVVAGVDLEGVLARHILDGGVQCTATGCSWQVTATPTPQRFVPLSQQLAAHQAERVRAALTEALGGGAG